MLNNLLYFAYWICRAPDEYSTLHIGIATTLENAVDISHEFMKQVMNVENSGELGRDRVVIEGWIPNNTHAVLSMDLPEVEKLLERRGKKDETD